MGNLSLLQGILPIQGSNPGLLHCRQMLYQLSHKGGPGKIKGKRKRGLQRVRWLDAITDSMDMKVKVKSLSRVRLFVTPWSVAYQAPPSMGFSGQEYWSGLPFSSPGDFPDPGIEPGSPAFQADALTSEPPGKPKRSYEVL